MAIAVTPASQSSVTGNPFAVGDAASLSAGPVTDPGAPTRYEEAVLADKPTLYLPLTEMGGATAFDHSGNGFDGTYDLGVTHEGAGPLLDEPDVAVFGNGQVVSQSGDMLPSGSTPRTLEFWVHNVANQVLTLASYGDIEGGHGFAVTISEGVLKVEASGHDVSAPTLDGFGHWCCDSTGWHMVDVTYDGETAEIYQDGQLIGGGVLGDAETDVPGQGLRLDSSHNQCCGGAAPYGFAEAAIYPTALNPEQVGAHWSAGASVAEQPTCAPVPTGPYPTSVLEDSPLVYYRVGDRAAYPTDRVAFDSSGHCHNASFDIGTNSGAGALEGDEDAAIYGNGQAVFQSGDTLPSGSKPRTLEFWVHNVANQVLTLASYGDIEGGHGFAVTISEGVLKVEASGHDVSAPTVDGFGHWCCDSTGWHMVDVTFDERAAEIYQDGQLIGGGPLGEVETKVPGQGLRFDTSHNQCCGGAAPYGLDELAVYPSALSSARIVAHWEAAPKPPGGMAVLGGTATNGAGGRVEACPTSGAACRVNPDPIDTSGSFHMLVPDGTYATTIFPPPDSSSGAVTLGPTTVPPSVFNLNTTFTPPGALPEGISFNGQENVVPTVNWGQGSTVTVKGCPEGFGNLFIQGTNTSTGAPETRWQPLVETPAGSGTYVAQIPPLAPVHGETTARPSIACGVHTHIFPDGGASAGGTATFIAGSGFTGAKAVHFGTAAASSFTVVKDDLIEAVSPPGTGSVSVTVTTASSEAVTAGTFNYFDVTSISETSGPFSGGTTVKIHGSGFTDVKGVIFGLLPATSVIVNSPTELEAVAPVGVGIDDVQVLDSAAISQPVGSAQFTYQGGPPGSSAIREGLGSDAQALLADDEGTLQGELPGELREAISNIGSIVLHSALTPVLFVPLGAVIGFAVCGPACAVFGALVAPVMVFAYDLADTLCEHSENAFCKVWKLFVDPSGTVVDTTGNPLSGATVTLLSQAPGGGPFSAVDASGGTIIPATNPETSGASGAFEWDALAGAYEVQASAPGCHAPDDAVEPNVFTSPFSVPPPAVGLVVTLECPGSTAPKPSVSGLSPASGPTSGGNVVDILGEDLAGVTSVRFGATPAAHVQVLSPYAVAAVAPAGSSTANITVTTKGGTSETGPATAYSYLEPAVTPESPVVSDVTPGSGVASGGTSVTIRGSHLGEALAVNFGSTPAAQVDSLSSTEVQAVAPAVAFPVRVDVTVTTPAGTSAPTLADAFVYGSPPPPLVTSVSLTASPNPTAVGQTVGLTAVVAPTDGGGTVAFYADGSSTPISDCGAQTLSQSGTSSQATCSTTGLAVGSHTLSAAYSGDASYAGSSGSANLSVSSPSEPSEPTGGGSTTGSGGSSGGGSPGAKGGVLSYQIVHVTSTQIAAMLAGQLIPSGRAARIAALLKHGGWVVAFRALEAGTAMIGWYQLPQGAKLAKRTKVKPVLVAAGHLTFSVTGTATLNVKLTSAGKRLLQHARHLKLTAKGTFTPTGTAPVIATKTFVLKR